MAELVPRQPLGSSPALRVDEATSQLVGMIGSKTRLLILDALFDGYKNTHSYASRAKVHLVMPNTTDAMGK